MIDSIVIDLPAIVKARTSNDGRRLVSCEASNESIDTEGDVILQSALLGAADSFIKSGHLDIDHLSELGSRFGIRDPESYIVGRPVEVKDIGDRRTIVTGEIMKSATGEHNPGKHRYDAFWDSLQAEPPVIWRASIYGFPKADEIVDCTEEICASGAWRYVVKGIDWRSMAFTRTPINDSIKGHARIVTAKAWTAGYAKSGGMPEYRPENQSGPPPAPMAGAPIANALMPYPRNMDDAVGQYHGHIRKDCPHCAVGCNTVGLKAHFEQCCGMEPHMADVWAHALMHRRLLDQRRV